jgi:tetratricopeptide (TPR) repeat protein
MKQRILYMLGLTLVGTGAFADDVYLRNGGHMIAERVRPEQGSLVVDLDGGGRVTVPFTLVERIEHTPTDRAIFHARAAALAPEDGAGWLALGVWARAKGLDAPAREAFERVLLSDPENAAANEGLGRVRLDGRWMSGDEAQEARGFVRYEGRWMRPEERDARERDRADAEDRAQRRREADARVREAEARADEAAARVREARATAQRREAEADEAEARADEAESRAREAKARARWSARGTACATSRHAAGFYAGGLYANGPGSYFTVCTVNGQPRLCVPVIARDCGRALPCH